MFYAKFVYECRGIGLKPSKLLEELGMSKGNLSAWRKGKLPSGKTLSTLAKRFNITVDELLDSDNLFPFNNDLYEEVEKALELNDIRKKGHQSNKINKTSKSDNPDLAKMLQSAPGLMFNGAPLSDDDREKILKAIKFAMDLGDKK